MQAWHILVAIFSLFFFYSTNNPIYSTNNHIVLTKTLPHDIITIITITSRKESVMKKILSLSLCVIMLLCTVSCAPAKGSEKTYDELKALYNGLISEYTSLLADKQEGKELTSPDNSKMDSREIAISDALYGIVDACKNPRDAEYLGYGYKDVDNNGTPELILLNKYATVKAIFTISNDLPLLLEANYGAGNTFSFATGNRFLLMRNTLSDNIGEMTYYTCHVDGDKMVYESVYGKKYNKENNEIIEIFKNVDGERIIIDEESFRHLNREHQKSCQTGYGTVTKLEAPYIHLPLSDSVSDKNLPVADFSSYVAIRNTYLAISDCLEEFNSSKWEMGEYDNLFSFPSDTYFEYYIKLLYTAYFGVERMGYDEIDLNGDGVDELVLLDEDYRIKAIFTQKNGSPVLIDSFVYSYHTCWLDENGLIHVDRESYDELEYSLYEFTKEGDYKLHYSILVANYYGRYITRNGKTELISYEDSMTLFYDEYCSYTAPFAPNEHTRNLSGMTYTPLSAETNDVLKVGARKSWHKYVNLERYYEDILARSNTYITFENLTDTQVDMKIRYAFTTSYPDPNRENYLLDETVEDVLSFTASREGDVFTFDGNGIKGSLKFGENCLWLSVVESSDERFSIGSYCFDEYKNGSVIE